jgi:hypothetical protein
LVRPDRPPTGTGKHASPPRPPQKARKRFLTPFLRIIAPASPSTVFQPLSPKRLTRCESHNGYRPIRGILPNCPITCPPEKALSIRRIASYKSQEPNFLIRPVDSSLIAIDAAL